jgi:DNA-binding NarL/FixJ family response regulator
MTKCRIILADDHTPVRNGLKMVLAQRPDFEVAGEACDGLELLSLLKHGDEPDVVILDISMPRSRGIKAIHEIKQLHPRVKVLVLTMHKDEDFVSQAFEQGADGYLLKEDVIKELFCALDTIAAEKPYLSLHLGSGLGLEAAPTQGQSRDRDDEKAIS